MSLWQRQKGKVRRVNTDRPGHYSPPPPTHLWRCVAYVGLLVWRPTLCTWTGKHAECGPEEA